LQFGTLNNIYSARKQTSYNLDKTKGLLTESFEIYLSTSETQNESVVIHVEDALYRWNKWRIVTSVPPHTVHEDEGKIYWVINVKPKVHTKISYTVQYHSIPQQETK